MSDKKNILITGANGQLGMEFRAMAATFTGFEFIFVSKEEVSITDTDSIIAIFEMHDVFCCINCAAYTNVDKAETEKEKAFEINGTAVGQLASICKKYKSHFFHFSTDYVFPGTASLPYKETDPTDPVNIYGASKLEGEKQAIEHNEGSVIIRTSWVYSSHGKNFVKTMLRLFRENTSVKVVNDQAGSPTYAGDLAFAVMQIISTDYFIPGIYHFCNGGIISWHRFASEIKKLVSAECKILPVTTDQFLTPAKRPRYSALDTSRIKDVFGVQVRGWEESLEKCLGMISKDA
ncbi:MAG TPA: dTDP-4-dehydrorhamnose reductase [Ferruginibacter sp.]|nr:dTDP-4-dehydrorhamnose reductase [Ferruginibacter sp.]